jgi:hypothetical protein
VDRLAVTARASYAMEEDTATTIPVPGDPATTTLVVTPSHGAVTIDADGLVYVPAPDFSGTDEVGIDVATAAGPQTWMVELQVMPVDDPPVSLPDAYSVPADGNLVVDAPGLLANDVDCDTPTLSATLVGPPRHGTLSLYADGSFSYVPEPGFRGTDFFAYRANDGGSSPSVPTVVSLSVTDKPDAPVAVDDVMQVDEDGRLMMPAPGVLANDRAVWGGLHAALVAAPAHGRVSLFDDGTFVYVPDADFNGDDTIVYRAVDHGVVSAPATITVHVAPVVDRPRVSNDVIELGPDGVGRAGTPGLLANDGDADGRPLAARLARAPSHGALTLGQNGWVVYMPGPDYAGEDSFTYVASDGMMDSEVATVTIVGQLPVAGVAPPATAIVVGGEATADAGGCAVGGGGGGAAGIALVLGALARRRRRA